jgi:hypothetical protein
MRSRRVRRSGLTVDRAVEGTLDPLSCFSAVPSHVRILSLNEYLPEKDSASEGECGAKIHRNLLKNGRTGRTRTCDPLLRRQMLYPPELRSLGNSRAGNRRLAGGKPFKKRRRIDFIIPFIPAAGRSRSRLPGFFSVGSSSCCRSDTGCPMRSTTRCRVLRTTSRERRERYSPAPCTASAITRTSAPPNSVRSIAVGQRPSFELNSTICSMSMAGSFRS